MVQERAVRLLVRQDNILRAKDRDRQVAIAMIASGRMTPAEALPEEFLSVLEAVEDESGFDPARDDVDYDFSGVEWESPEGMTAEALAELDEFLALGEVEVPAFLPGEEPR